MESLECVSPAARKLSVVLKRCRLRRRLRMVLKRFLGPGRGRQQEDHRPPLQRWVEPGAPDFPAASPSRSPAACALPAPGRDPSSPALGLLPSPPDLTSLPPLAPRHCHPGLHTPTAGRCQAPGQPLLSWRPEEALTRRIERRGRKRARPV
ncbi:hypothetical protein P7K49_029699 [Saguinus oedipus]|uniref:Uncharacterized protein n=1 Tax=Saguinus oedipus TaxID=9490 RepID=A0ABQ9U7X3_SAGOE|nr:hypothetical protein P7K49_029699 [Saguinus oedipus]